MSQLIYFNLGVRCCKNFFFLRNLSISSKLFGLCTQNCSIICYSFNIYVPIVTSYLSFLILIIFFPLSILFAVSKNYLLVLLIFSIVFLISICFFADLYYLLSSADFRFCLVFFLILLGVIIS